MKLKPKGHGETRGFYTKEMNLSQFFKKTSQVFSSNKKKEKNNVIKGHTPQNNSLPSSNKQEEEEECNDDEKKQKSDDLKEVTKLFIGCLAPSTTSEELEDYFSRFGKVINSVVMRYPKSRKSRGFGFVTFVYPESAKAVLETKDHTLNGKTINPQPFRFKSNERNYGNRIFLGSLPFDSTEEDVKQFFSKFGEVEDVIIPLERKTMKSKGFGFLSFKDKFIAEKLIAEGFVYMKKRRVLIKRAEPPDLNKINDNYSIHNGSDMSIEEGLEISENFFSDVQFLSASDDDSSSGVSGERQHLGIELNAETQKFFEDYFLLKFSQFNKMNEKNSKVESNKGKFINNDTEEVEKLLADFFINSNEQFRAFGEDLIEFSDNSECNSCESEKDTTDEEKDDTDDDDDDDDTCDLFSKNSESTFQELSTQFTKILKGKSRSQTEILEFKSVAPQTSEFLTSQKSSTPMKIKDEKGSFVCTLCQWEPPENSCENFLAHCKTAAHRIKLKERFLSDQNQEGTLKTVFSQISQQTQEICSKPERFSEKHSALTEKSSLKNQNQNQKNQKYRKKEQKQLPLQEQPQALNILIKKKRSKIGKEKNRNDEKHMQDNSELKSKKIRSIKISALAKSMACIQLLSEDKIICKICKKIIPKALDTNTLMKNVSHHIQSKGHLKKVLEIENSLRKGLEGNDEKQKSGDTKKKNCSENNAKEKKTIAIAPKVKISNQNLPGNAGPLLKEQKSSNQKKVSRSKNPPPETTKSDLQKQKTDKKKLCSNAIDLKAEYLCLPCNSYFQNSQLFDAHVNSKIHLNCLDKKNMKSVSRLNNLQKCNNCKLFLIGSLYDINMHYVECIEQKN